MLCRTWMVRLAVLAGCATMAPAFSQAEEAGPRMERRRMVVWRDGGPAVRLVVQAEEGDQRGPRRGGLSSHWVGIECFPLDAALRSHLGLAENEGLMIEQIVPDSPAAKAELKQYDVILKAGETSIKAVPDLMQAIDEVKDKELALQVVRAGKTITIAVTPAERPQREDVLRRVPQPGEELRRWMERFDQQQRGPFRYRVFGPGAILPGEEARLPKGVTVRVERSADEPAKITVKRGDESWEVTEKELDKLPKDLRPHVERMLGRGPLAILPGMAGEPAFAPPLPQGRPQEGGVNKQLEQMMDQLQQLQRRMEELQKTLPQEDKPAPKKDTRA